MESPTKVAYFEMEQKTKSNFSRVEFPEVIESFQKDLLIASSSIQNT